MVALHLPCSKTLWQTACVVIPCNLVCDLLEILQTHAVEKNLAICNFASVKQHEHEHDKRSETL